MNDDRNPAPITYEDLVRDPAYALQIERRARHLRAVEGGRALSGFLRGLLKRAAPAARPQAAPLAAAPQGMRTPACG